MNCVVRPLQKKNSFKPAIDKLFLDNFKTYWDNSPFYEIDETRRFVRKHKSNHDETNSYFLQIEVAAVKTFNLIKFSH